MDYEIQYARLATTEKLPDRFLNAQLRANSDLSKVNMGQVFSLVEILTPWFPTAQIGQTIINTFGESYWQGGSTSDLANFEDALKHVNETLAQITQNGETDWIGNVNATLGVLVENKLHIAQTGKAEAYVFRDGKINHLTEGLAQSGGEPHPLKTFSNVTSGELRSRDKILIANPELFKQIDLENLRQIILMGSPKEAILQLAKLLKKKKKNTVNVLILHLLSSEEYAKLPVENGDDTIYLDKPLESIWASVQRAWQQLIFPILKSFGKSSQKAGSKSLKFTQNYLATLKDKRTRQEPVTKKDLYEKEFIGEDSTNTLLKDEEIKYSPDLDVHYYNENKKQKEDKFGPILKKAGGYASGAGRFILNLVKNKKLRPYILIITAVIILSIIALVINGNRGKAGSNINLNEAQGVLRTAQDALNDGKQAANSNDKEKAKILFVNAIDNATKITDKPVVGSEAKNVLTQAYIELDKLTSTTRFGSLSPIIKNSENTKNAFVISGSAYLVTDNNISRGSISGGNVEKVATIPKSGGTTQFSTLIGENIYIYTSTQKIYEFQPKTGKIDLAKMDAPNWETANAITNYAGTIYLLDGIVGQIYRHTSSSDSFAAGSPYVNAGGIDIKNAKSITIDGDVYVLTSNGQAIKLSRSKLQEFSLRDLPSPNSKIETPVKIYTDSDSPYLFVLDNGISTNGPQLRRIVEFDKDGHFTHQYALPNDIGDISDFFVSVKAKKLWILSNNNVYEISI